MKYYCPIHDERFGPDAFMLMEDCLEYYYEDGRPYFEELQVYIHDLNHFIYSHRDCNLVVNDRHGRQLYPENIAKKTRPYAYDHEPRTTGRLPVDETRIVDLVYEEMETQRSIAVYPGTIVWG